MSVLQTLTKIAKALLPRDGSTRERSIQVHHRIEGAIESVDAARWLITVRRALEQNAKGVLHVSEKCKITLHGEKVRFDHFNLYDHVWVVFNKDEQTNRLEALDIEVIS